MQQPKRPLRKPINPTLQKSISIVSQQEPEHTSIPPLPEPTNHNRFSSQVVPKHIIDDTIEATDELPRKGRAPSSASTTTSSDLYLTTKKRLIPGESQRFDNIKN